MWWFEFKSTIFSFSIQICQIFTVFKLDAFHVCRTMMSSASFSLKHVRVSVAQYWHGSRNVAIDLLHFILDSDFYFWRTPFGNFTPDSSLFVPKEAFTWTMLSWNQQCRSGFVYVRFHSTLYKIFFVFTCSYFDIKWYKLRQLTLN